ncbi:MAG: NAD(P)H-dependent oxidoreductase subunit E [Thermoplasmata archaeon]|nr:NAD(P)H-dependent oxidoreductase subunit E [Thermoplasmata archaeon]
MHSTDKIGSVLVIGGGIGGIQSALDLADSGFRVYLLDRKPSIGGAMAQLDKTFPTNDCSMCIEAPKMVDAARHPNIELVTFSDLMTVEGEAGRFRVKVRKNARSIDEAKCTGCGVCIENCPVLFQAQLPEGPRELPKLKDQEYIEGVISKNSGHQEPLVQIMLDINENYSYLPRDVLEYLSIRLDVPLARVFRLATFYKAFNLKRRGKYHIKVCMGTACHVRDARKVVDALRDQISEAEDGLFSLETVNCLGACALGPVMLVNEEVHGHMSVDKVSDILSSLEGE